MEALAAGNGRRVLEDTYAEWDDEETIAAIEAALSRAGEVIRLEADQDFPSKLRAAQPDIVFNFAEGMGGLSRESHVPAFCEFWGIPYTGSDPITLGICLDKARTKETLSHHGIPTPEFQVVECPDDVRRSLPLPVIVKPLHEGSSKGITQRSFCATWSDVEAEVARVVDRYDEPAIVERFLGGREFTVALLGNDGDGRALPIVELDFATLPRDAHPIYGFEAKWVWDVPERPLDIFHCPARCTPELQHRIEEIAMAAFRKLRCRDWARIDIRCDERGDPQVIEVNPLPGVIPDPAANSCYPKAARAAGLSFDELIVSVLRAAAARYDVKVPG
ncbi:MAG: ATP-grasp domain-containing protein [Gemmatimonadota bacterium]|nr:MAG: ATP-grasp domain-containing protein [Gemmatimonadota bacterium]